MFRGREKTISNVTRVDFWETEKNKVMALHQLEVPELHDWVFPSACPSNLQCDKRG